MSSSATKSSAAKSILQLSPLFLVLVIDAMGFGIVFPLIGPLFLVPGQGLLDGAISMNIRELLYGLSITCFFLFVLLGSPYVGDLSDKLGRKKVILICLFGVGLAYILSVVSILYHNVWLFLFSRCLAGFLTGSQSIAQAAIIDISSPDTKAKNLAFMTLAGCLGFSIGPLIGGIFSSSQQFAWMNVTTPFLMAAILAFLNGIGLIFLFKETHEVKTSQKVRILQVFDMLKQAWFNKKVREVSFLFLVMQLGWGLFYQYTSLSLIQTMHFSGLKIGLFNTLIGIIFSITLVFLIRLFLKFLSVTQLMLVSLLTQGIATALFAFISNELSLWILLIPVTLSVGLAYTALLTLYSDGVSPDRQGWAMGVSEAVMAIAWISGSLLMAVVSIIPQGSLYIIAGLMPLLGIYPFLRKRQPNRIVAE